jgi:hypothetical protein
MNKKEQETGARNTDERCRFTLRTGAASIVDVWGDGKGGGETDREKERDLESPQQKLSAYRG